MQEESCCGSLMPVFVYVLTFRSCFSKMLWNGRAPTDLQLEPAKSKSEQQCIPKMTPDVMPGCGCMNVNLSMNKDLQIWA